MADSSTSSGDPADSSTSALPESSAQDYTPSSPRMKREHDDTEDASSDLPNKRQRQAYYNGFTGPQISSSRIKGPMGSLSRALDWVDDNEDLSDEAKEMARQLRALVCNPNETDFRGYRTEESANKEGDGADVKIEVKAEAEEEEEEVKNPHTNVPPPFALPDKSKFMKGPTPALENLNKAAPPLSTLPPMPAAKNFNTTNNVAAPLNTVLPAAPPITNVALAQAPFMHTSLLPAYVAPTGTNSYEPLEFLGDAYLEVIATRLIHSRFPLHTVGQKAGLRELLVKNETLAEYAKAYGFGERVQSSHKERHGPVWTKVLGDVFEAYLACIIIQEENSDAGFLAAERWLTELWAPKILEWRNRGDGLQDASKQANQPLDPKTDLNRLLSGKDAKIEYREEKEMQLIKEGNRTIFFMGVYFTGWGFTNQHLGSGEGRSKQIASTNAAEDAMKSSQDIIKTANARKQQYERQFKKVGGARGRGGGHHHGGRGGGRGGFGGYQGRGGGAGVGFQGPPQGYHAGAYALPPQHHVPQYPPQHHQPPPAYYGQPQHPAPGSWAPPGH